MPQCFIQTKVMPDENAQTRILLGLGKKVVEATFAKSRPLIFPIFGSAAIPVSIPENGSRAHVAFPTMGGIAASDPESLDLPLKFPLYLSVSEKDAQALDTAGNIVSKNTKKASNTTQPGNDSPLIAIATRISGTLDGRLVQAVRVLPVWADGTCVMISLDWTEGCGDEGTPNPEWFIKTSKGFQLLHGMKRLARGWPRIFLLENLRYSILMAPHTLGRLLISEEGMEHQDDVWKYEWQTSSHEQFNQSMTRLMQNILGEMDPCEEDSEPQQIGVQQF